MKKKFNILIVGLGWQQEFGIKKIHNNSNFYLIGIDKDPKPICIKYLDKFIRCDTDNIEECLFNINLTKRKIDHVITFNSEALLILVAKLKKKLGINNGLKLNQINNLINKLKIKEILNKNKIITQKYQIFKRKKKLERINIDFPLIMKPIDSSGSRGVTYIKNKNQLIKAYDISLNYSKNHKIILEEYIRGKEFSIESIVNNNEHHIISIHRRIKKNKISASEIYTVNLSNKKINLIDKYFKKIIKIFKINNTPLHSEIIIDKNNIIYLIDISPRGGGFMVADGLVNLTTNVNISEYVINMAIDETVTMPKIYRNKFASIRYFLPKRGKIKKISLKKDINKRKEYYYKFFIKKGDLIDSLNYDGDRFGYVICAQNTLLDARKKTKNFLNNLLIEME